MPLYEYKCLKCGRHTDKIEGVSGPHLKKCPHCGGKVESVITAQPATETKEAAGKEKDTAAKETATKETTSTESKEKKPAKKK